MRQQDSTGSEIALYETLIAVSHNILIEHFEEEISPRAVSRMTDALKAQADAILDEVQRQRQPAVACRSGCSWCCHTHVYATPLEILRLGEVIREQSSPEQFEAFKQRVREVAAHRREGHTDEREDYRHPCPLLVEHRCAFYAARPLACRSWTSRDAEVCRLNIENPGGDAPPVQFYRPYREVIASIKAGIRSGLNQTPLQNVEVELATGLDLVLNSPDIAERWLEGEPVFEAALLLNEDE